MSLIWNLWCQKCAFDLRDGEFQVGFALFRAWQMTVQAGMGAWQLLTQAKAGPKSRNQIEREAAFISTWSFGNIFCKTANGIHWQLVPHNEFLTRDMANRYSRFRPPQPTPPSPGRMVHPPSPAQSEDTTFPSPRNDIPVLSLIDPLPQDSLPEPRVSFLANLEIEELEDRVTIEEDGIDLPGGATLPESLQTPEDLADQTRFWIGETSGRGCPSPPPSLDPWDLWSPGSWFEEDDNVVDCSWPPRQETNPDSPEGRTLGQGAQAFSPSDLALNRAVSDTSLLQAGAQAPWHSRSSVEAQPQHRAASSSADPFCRVSFPREPD